jgi:hypothetical protein
MEGGEATECFIPAKKGGEARTGARHDDGKVAAGQNSSRGGATWSAWEKARGKELERRPAWRRRVRAARAGGGAGRATAAVSCGGDGKELLAARAAAWRARGRPAGGAKAVGEFGGDVWSGAGAGDSHGRRGMTACGGAAAVQRRGGRGRRTGVALGADLQFQKFQGPHCKPRFPTILRLKRENGQNESCRTFQTLQLLFSVPNQKLKG